jgi:ATP-dependent helicase HrpB
VLGRESGVLDAEFIVAIDVQAGKRGEGAEATIRVASAIEADWLRPGSHGTSSHGLHDSLSHGSHGSHGSRTEHVFDAASGRVRAIERTYYGEIPIAEKAAPVDPEIASRLLAEAYLARGWSDADTQLLRRLRFAELPVDPTALVAAAAMGRRSIDEIDLRAALPSLGGRDIDRRAPETIAVPSGRTARLSYQEDGGVVAAVKLQELFGLAESPRLGPRQVPVVFELLAPNGRPVQTTRDLRSFWDTTYQDVRKELRGRYPRHPWPEDPWTAPPTAKAKRRL